MDPQSDIAQPNGKQTPSTGVPQVPQTSPLPQEGQVYTQSPMGAASEVTPIQQQANMPVYPQSATHQYPPMNPGVPAQVFANVPPMQGSGYPNQMPPYQPMSMPGQGIPQAQPMTQGMPPYGGVQQGVPINGQPFPVQGQMMPPQVQVPPRSSKKVLVTILVLLLTSGAAYGMYVYKDTIKARLPYFGSAVVFTEDNFTTSMIDKFKTVNSAEYTVSGNIYVRDRESGVVSMDSKAAPTPERVAAYALDYQKLQVMNGLMSILRYSSKSTYVNGKYVTTKTYPKNLLELKQAQTSRYSGSGYYGSKSSSVTMTDDQIIDAYITYLPSIDGQGYTLSVLLENQDAIAVAKEAAEKNISYYVRTDEQKYKNSVSVDGGRITVNQDYPSSIFITSEIPKPLLAQLGFYLKELPQDFKLAATTTILSKLEEGKKPELSSSVTAEGDFSDLSYKLGLDVILKEDMLYYHIANFPALGLFSGLTSLKGKWIKVDMSPQASSTKDMFGSMSFEVQKDLEKNKELSKKTLGILARSADASKLISFVTPPIHEKLEGKNVTKYQLTVKKESLRSFLDALEKEASADPELAKSSKGIAEYKKEIEKMLDSPDFNEVYDYTKSNIFLTVWTREDGVPVRMEVRFRVVPSLESKNLADKQIEIVLTMMLNKINETIMIEEPKDAKTYREVVGTSTRGFLW